MLWDVMQGRFDQPERDLRLLCIIVKPNNLCFRDFSDCGITSSFVHDAFVRYVSLSNCFFLNFLRDNISN